MTIIELLEVGQKYAILTTGGFYLTGIITQKTKNSIKIHTIRNEEFNLKEKIINQAKKVQ